MWTYQLLCLGIPIKLSGMTSVPTRPHPCTLSTPWYCCRYTTHKKGTTKWWLSKFSSACDSTGEALPKLDGDDDRSQSEEGVFIFTATASSTEPKSPDYVKSKLKGVGVLFNLLPEEITGAEEGETIFDELALLAQQVELGGAIIIYSADQARAMRLV